MVYAITAIDWSEIEDLMRHGIKTFELVCADHITTATRIKKGEMLFITNLSKQDVVKGTRGVLAQVLSVKTGYWRTVPREFDEKELLTARIQVRYLDEVQVQSVRDKGLGKGMEVEIKEHAILG